MPAQLPTDTSNRNVRDFGIGTYDSPVQSEYDEEGIEFFGESVPAGIIGNIEKSVTSYSLPGDLDRPPQSRKKPEDSILTKPLKTVSQSQLPYDSNNPSARSDYYDRTKIGVESLPEQPSNFESLDKYLQPLGNWLSGWTVTDMTQPISFPVIDRSPEEVDKYTSFPTGTASGRGSLMNRQATNIDLVGTLTSDFIKKHGKKDITRRHVMAFLSTSGYHQYLASDIIRCLQQRHNVHVPDVLDHFIEKSASVSSNANEFRQIIDIANDIGLLGILASSSVKNVYASNRLKCCGDTIMKVVFDLVGGSEDV